MNDADATALMPLGTVAGWPSAESDSVEVDSGRVAWARGPQQTKISAQTVAAFTALAKGSDRRVGDFVKKWGPLEICSDHDLPVTHNPLGYGRVLERGCRVRRCGGTLNESVDAYRSLASTGASLVALGQALQRSAETVHLTSRVTVASMDFDPVAASHPSGTAWTDWEPVADLVGRARLEAHFTANAMSLANAKMLLGSGMEAWLCLGDVRVRWEWRPKANRPAINVEANSLFGALALAIARSTTDSEPLPVCEECGRAFTPERRRSTVRWCPDHRATAMKRESERRRRAKRRAERTENVAK